MIAAAFDFDAEVIRPSLWRGSALAGTSRGQVRRQAEIPEEQQPQPISRMDEVLLRRERWGLRSALGCAALRARPYERCRQRERLLGMPGSALSRLGTGAGMRDSELPALGGVHERSMQISLISGVWSFSPPALQIQVAASFCTGKEKL